jgi:hypothetical protein
LWRPYSKKEKSHEQQASNPLGLHRHPPRWQREKGAGTVWSHNDGGGFDVVILAGVTVTGRIVCRKRKEQPAK